MARGKAAGQRSAAVQYALQLWLYGGPDGKRITNMGQLAKITGTNQDHLSTVKAQDDWQGKLLNLQDHQSSTGLAIQPGVSALALVREQSELLEQKLGEISARIEGMDVEDPAFEGLLRKHEALCKRWERFSGAGLAIENGLSRAREMGRRAGKGEPAKPAKVTEIDLD